MLEGGAGRHNNLSHVTLNYPTDLPESDVLARIMSHLTCFEVFNFCNSSYFEWLNLVTLYQTNASFIIKPSNFPQIKHVTDDKFSYLRDHFHNLHTVILTACNCSDLDIPVSLIKELRVQGTVRGKLQLDKIM